VDTGPTHSIDLTGDPSCIGPARRFARQTIDGHVEHPDAVLLMTSELVSNVIEHAHGALRMTIGLGPPVRVEVHNHQAATDAFRELIDDPTMPDESAPSGRGLALVRQLSSRMGLADDPRGGKVVWFEYATADREAVAVVLAGGRELADGEVEGPNPA